MVVNRLGQCLETESNGYGYKYNVVHGIEIKDNHEDRVEAYANKDGEVCDKWKTVY
tara:strand:+ start:44 stop:211 length:168 start_codon:yes stop_codon:yes gene_type:complete